MAMMVAISRAGSSIFVKTESLSMLGLQKKIAFGVRRTLKALPQKRTDTNSSSSATTALSMSSHPWWFVDPLQNQFLNAVSPFNPRKNKKKQSAVFLPASEGRGLHQLPWRKIPRICERFDHSDPFDLRVSRISGVTGPTHRAEGVLEAEGFEGLWASKSVGFLGYLWGEHGFNT
jgi:hypothetical protein